MKQLAACAVLLMAVASPPALAEEGKAAPSFRIVVNSGITPVSHGDYRYPYNAGRRGLDGACEVEFVISKAGKPDAIRIRSCSSELFRGAAKQIIEALAFSESGSAISNVVAQIRWDIDSPSTG